MESIISKIKNADKKKKRFLSMFTAVFMVFTTFGDSLSVFADRADSIERIQKVSADDTEKRAELLDVPDADDKFLGIAGDFTIFVKDKFIIPREAADIEGRVAAGKGIENERGTYDIGSRYTGKGATVIVGGGEVQDILTSPANGAERRIFAVSSDTNVETSSYQNHLENFYIADGLIDFDAEMQKMDRLSEEISGYENTMKMEPNYDSWRLVGKNTEVNVFNPTADEWIKLVNAPYLHVYVSGKIMDSYIIINAPGNDVDIPHYSLEIFQYESDEDGNPVMEDDRIKYIDHISVKQDSKKEDGTYDESGLLCGHILYNAKDAENVHYTGSVQGSLLAPGANVKGERVGHVSGSTIAKSAEGFGIQAGSITFNPPKKVIVEEPDESEITVSKAEITGGPEIPGAVLEIRSKTGADLSEVTSSAKDFKNEDDVITFTSGNTSAVIKGLPDGAYTLTEITSPDGYTINKETVDFTVKDGKTEKTVTMLDEQAELSISKVDAANSEEIEGAVLTLILEKSSKTSNATLENQITSDGKIKAADENNTSITWVSSGTPAVFRGLPDGEYRLKESVAPDGYTITGDIKFTLKDGVVEQSTSSVPGVNDSIVDSDNNKIIMKDELAPEPEPEPSVINVSKKAISGSDELPGARLTIELVKPADEEKTSLLDTEVNGGALDAVSGKTTVEFTSGKDAAEVSGLPDGDYTLKETTSPDGYTVKEETISFTIRDGKVAGDNETTVTMFDKPSVISVSKMEINGTSEIPGAVLKLTLNESSKTQAADLKNQVNDTVKAANDDVTAVTWTSSKTPVVLTALPDGEYTLEESVAPDGYTITDKINFTIENGVLKSDNENVDAENGSVVMRDELSEIKISKRDINDSEELPGATLKLTLESEDGDLTDAVVIAASGNPVQTKTEIEFVSGNKETVIRKLPDGKYTLTEITSPDGYTVSEESVPFEIVNGAVTSGNNLVKMLDKPSSVKISKEDVAGKEIPGAVLTLKLNKASKSETADLADAAENSAAELDKTDSDNRTLTWTSGKTPTVLTGLPDGEYTLSETVAPDRYKVTGSKDFVIENGEVKNYDENKIVMTDELSEVTVSKKEINGTDEIPGAKLTITLKEAAEEGTVLTGTEVSGGAVDSSVSADKIVFISGEKPAVLTGLPDGKYELKETTSPDGYTVSDEIISFEVENGVLVSGKEVEMFDSPSEISVSKKAVSGSDEVPGAVLKLTLKKAYKTREITLEAAAAKTADKSVSLSSDNSRVLTWKSGTKPVELKGLPDGEYILEESVAPDGYTITDAVEFVIENGVITEINGNSSEGNSVVMRDELAKVTISKQKVSGTELSGAELTLTNDDNKSLENVVSSSEITAGGNTIKWTSGEKPVVLEGIPDGTYTLTEDRAPLGFMVSESITFTVKNGEVTDYADGTVVMVDYEEAKPSDILISKTDITDSSEVPGAKLTVTASDKDADLSKVISDADIKTEKNTITWISGKTPVTLTGLPDGTYTLEEITAPDGYTVNPESVEFTVKDGLIVGDDANRVVMQDAPSEINISKREINKSDELPGAKLTVTPVKLSSADADLSAVKVSGGAVKPSVSKDKITFTSGTEAAVITRLPDGVYELKETRSPDGYTVSEETVKFEIRNGVLVSDDNKNTVFMEDAPSEITISKSDIAMSDEIPGAVLTLTLKQAYKNTTADLKSFASDRISVDAETGRKITWTSGNEPLVIKGLPDGDYVLEECAAPDGYTITGKISFTVMDGVIESDSVTVPKPEDGRIDAENNKVTMIDELSEVSISKTNIAGREIPGAKLKLTITEKKDLSSVSSETKLTIEDNSVSWVSEDKPTVIFGLPDGTYTLEETQAPDGYAVTESMTFTIENGVPSSEEIVMVDEYTRVTISKTDVAGSEIPGAKLILTQNEGTKDLSEVTSDSAVEINKKTVTWTSSDKPVVLEGLPDGEYTLEESIAPDGYTITDSVKFKVVSGEVQSYEATVTRPEDSRVDSKTNSVIMVDAPSSVSIRKTDAAGSEVAGAKLTLTLVSADEKGAGLENASVSGGASEVVKTAVSISFISGKTDTVITGIPDGKYTLTETQAPDGYEIADTIDFTVENGKVSGSDDDTVIMVDEIIVTTTVTTVSETTTTKATTTTVPVTTAATTTTTKATTTTAPVTTAATTTTTKATTTTAPVTTAATTTTTKATTTTAPVTTAATTTTTKATTTTAPVTTAATTTTTKATTTTAPVTTAATTTTTKATTTTAPVTTAATTTTTTVTTTVPVTTVTTTTTTTVTTTVTTTEATTTERPQITPPVISLSMPNQVTGIPETDVTYTGTTTEETTTEAETTEETTVDTTVTEDVTTASETTDVTTASSETTSVLTTASANVTSPKITAQNISATPKTGDTRSSAAAMVFMAGSVAAMLFVKKKND